MYQSGLLLLLLLLYYLCGVITGDKNRPTPPRDHVCDGRWYSTFFDHR